MFKEAEDDHYFFDDLDIGELEQIQLSFSKESYTG